MTIVSASYRTDIPAFYADWFAGRLDAGTVRVASPWGGRPQLVSLAPDRVAGFVFWTRNPAPFEACLARVAARWPFVLQLTVTGYPRALDRSVVAAPAAIASCRRLAAAYGPGRVVWRYDPIVVSSTTPAAWHRENFARLADALAGSVDEVVVSFMQVYRKTRRNMDRAAAANGFAWTDPDPDLKLSLLAELAAIARDAGLRLTLCAQPELLARMAVGGVAPASCIDPVRLFGPDRSDSYRLSKNRPGCLCAEARDIGGYDSCPHGCVYCYAVADAARAKANYNAHDRAAEALNG